MMELSIVMVDYRIFFPEESAETPPDFPIGARSQLCLMVSTDIHRVNLRYLQCEAPVR